MPLLAWIFIREYMVERREFMGGKTDGFMLATARTRDIAYSAAETGGERLFIKGRLFATDCRCAQ
jgi:hypothetical protein